MTGTGFGAPLAGSSYASVPQLRAWLKDVPPTVANDALMQEFLDDATCKIELELGFALAAYGAAAAQDVQAARGVREILTTLPAHQVGSIVTVRLVYDKGWAPETTEEVYGWTELADGRPYCDAGWLPGAWYRITASWGYGPASKAIERICLEKARDAWYNKDASASVDSAGLQGAGGIAVQRTWTDEQWRVIQRTREQAGEW